MALDLGDLLARSRVVICLGPGGTGKTSTAAAIALESARRGRRTALCTIDPAPRLADALGLSSQAPRHTPQALAADLAERAGIPADTLFGLILDERAALDDLLARYAPDEQARAAILAHPWYRSLTDRLAGVREYLALDLLYHLTHNQRFDMVVLDTPPSPNALDFFRAPARVLSMFNSELVASVLTPLAEDAAGRGRKGGIFKRALALKVLSYFTGEETLRSIAVFMLTMYRIFSALVAHVGPVQEVLRSPRTAILLVSAPWSETISETQAFATAIRHLGLTARAIIVNRLCLDPYREAEPTAGAAHLARLCAEQGLDGPQTQATLAYASHLHTLARQQRESLETLYRMTSEELTPIVTVPLLPHTLHDVPALMRLRQALFEPPRPPRTTNAE